MASLPAERAEAREIAPLIPAELSPLLQVINRWVPPSIPLSDKLTALGYCVKDGVIERLPEKAEKSWGAFEPFSYTERN